MKQSDKHGERNRIGAYGEEIAARYLEKRGLRMLDRNYLRKWGEIDLIFQGTDGIHFVEVKTVSYETRARLDRAIEAGTWRPEENVHQQKLRRMHRAIETWLAEQAADVDWYIDVVAVRLVVAERSATVKYIPNIIQ